jgi:Spy/CpxP family protein refolding chaperone
MQNLIQSSILILALGVSTAAFAQSSQDAQQPSQPVVQHQPNPKHQARELAKRLSLTPDQTAQIEPILADRDQKIAALNSNTAIDPKSVRQQRRAIMVDTESKLNAILTPAQQQQYATLRQQHRQHEGAPAAPPAPSPSL